MKVINQCPVCAGEKFAPFLKAVDHTVSHETFTIKLCSTCGFLVTSPRPADESIGTYYKSDNYISHSGKSANAIDKVYLIARSFTLNWKSKILTKHVRSTNQNLLDYGCGTGEFLHHSQSKGWIPSGVEPSEVGRQKTTQLIGPRVASELSEIANEKFGAITLWHVLEHVAHLSQTLSALRERLDENGTLFIAVPNHIGYDGEYYREHWAGYDVPRHLWHFSPTNMRLLLEQNQLKLNTVIPMKLDAYYISLLSEKYKRGKHTIPGIIKAIWTALRSNTKARKTGNYSSLIYIARK